MPGETNVIQHRLKLTYDTPICRKPYRLPYAMRKELLNEVDSMLEMGVVCHQHHVKRRSWSWLRRNRVCVDLRKLNKITKVDSEFMSTGENLFRRLNGKKYLSKIDLTKGYWQKLVASEDVYKTAFVTPDGQYEFLRIPFGMLNSGATLARRLRKVVEGLSCQL